MLVMLSSPFPTAVWSALGLVLDADALPADAPVLRPRSGQTVAVSFVGRLAGPDGPTGPDGAVFDESKEPLEVRVGRSQVIAGWDIVLPFLAVGQRARVTVPPTLAYAGKGAAKGRVPPHATLKFELCIERAIEDASDRLLDAAACGDAVGVSRALADGAAIEHRDRKGWRALHWAADTAEPESVIRLIESRADVDALATQPAGAAPLVLAARAGSAPIVAALLHAGADPSRQTVNGSSALSVARKRAAASELVTLLENAIEGVAGGAAGGAAAAADDDSELELGTRVGRAGWEGLRTRCLRLRRLRAANPRCWMSLSCVPLDAPADAGAQPPWGTAAPRVVFELWADVVPRTAENFRALCTGEHGACRYDFRKPPLHYRGNIMHRIITGNVMQGGDITSGDGRGGESIYGRSFEDESFAGRAGSHDRKGLLSMANTGPNSNGSQFFITLDALPHLDGKHVVFGRVIEGLAFVEAVAAAAGPGNPRDAPPKMRVVIEDCDVLERDP